jgi:hypothetical protein
MQKSKRIKVPVDAMFDVATFIDRNAITALVIGAGEGSADHIVLAVKYGLNQRTKVHQLEDLVDDKWSEIEDEDEEEEEDDEDDY